MAFELRVPSLGESVAEVEIGDWLKSEGEKVQEDDPVVVLESEKATVELPAPKSGVISKIVKKKGEKASIGEVIGYLEEGKGEAKKQGEMEEKEGEGEWIEEAEEKLLNETEKAVKQKEPEWGAKIAERRRREDEERWKIEPEGKKPQAAEGREEEVVPMSLLRRRIAERLVKAQRNQALLTTFNEIDMSEVIALRERYGKSFEEKHRIRLGVMSFFVKASIEALKLVPQVNAEIRGSDIVYRNYYDIGVAVGGGRGLVVPVLRNAERMSLAEIEAAIHDFARRARENKLKPNELQGGTFTITNGGVYGSLLSTPIINPPQSGILGMHVIQDRPVARGGQIAIRPMMYVALSYDHRIVDGREAVTFLKRIKECVECPSRILLET